ncbi:hypothetical protein B0H16DRAFT_659637 [Mycena metata]|uniref:Uncharacterized protein n=1 Tax=Mycena metata TaxID=1033252 RepID=A0AAD7NFT6_9AGAR|nr:hypothetical protein B0H16DRAFT_659637 [Mycena metata]
MLWKIAKLARGEGYYPLVDSLNTRKYSQTTIDLMDAAYKFCVVPDLPPTAIIYTLGLLPFLDIQNLSTVSDDYSWLYSHFEHIAPADELHLGCSLHVLDRALSTDQAPKPSVGFLKALLRVLTLSSTDFERSYNGAKSLTSNIICHQYSWFLDKELGRLLEKHSLWASLAQFSDVPSYLSLGERLSQTPKWKEFIWQDLPVWLLQLQRLWQNQWPRMLRTTSRWFRTLFSEYGMQMLMKQSF